MQKLNRRFLFMSFGKDIKPLAPGNPLILALLYLLGFSLFNWVIPGKNYPRSQDSGKAWE